jgi:hypothetical protein
MCMPQVARGCAVAIHFLECAAHSDLPPYLRSPTTASGAGSVGALSSSWSYLRPNGC